MSADTHLTAPDRTRPHPSAPAKTWLDRARQVTPGGVHSPVRAFAAMHCDPIAIVSARGARLTDSEGRSYIDYIGAWGPALLGHGHPGGGGGRDRRRSPRARLRPRLTARGRSRRAHRRARAGLPDGAIHRDRHRGDDERRPPGTSRHGPARHREVRRRLSRARRHVPRERGLWGGHLRRTGLARRDARGRRGHAHRPLQRRGQRGPLSDERRWRRGRGDRRAGDGQHGLRAAGRRVPRGAARAVHPEPARCSSSTR